MGDGEKEGEKLFFQFSQFWIKQFETANTVLTYSHGSFSPSFSLALTSEGPEAPHNPEVSALTPTTSRDTFMLYLQPNKPRGCFCFPDGLGKFHSRLSEKQTQCMALGSESLWHKSLREDWREV